jgi:protein-S-isoprenylcysteine O-methyltransferase Ste14
MPWHRPGVAAVIAPPPLLFLLCGGLAWGGEALFPWGFDWAPFETRLRIGASAALLASALAVWAIWTMWRAGTPVEPWEPTKRIVTRGPYRFTRNPIYVAMTLLFLAIALVVDSVWFYAALPSLVLLLHYGVILREEAYLLGKFGGEYGDYFRRVRRWI